MPVLRPACGRSQDCLTNDVERRPSMKEVVERLTAIDAAYKQLRLRTSAAAASQGHTPTGPALGGTDSTAR